MCIRDRDLRSSDLSAISSQILGMIQPLLSQTGTLVGSVAAVSYTHLRAHETVLDLVCRLLLEKKNEKESLTRACNTSLYQVNDMIDGTQPPRS